MLVTGIAELVTNEETIEDPDGLGRIHDAAVVVQDGRIEWVGEAAQAPAADWAVDLDGQTVVPGFVDSHSHLVFAGDRSGEFVARMAGRRYDGGGIAHTMAATRETDDEVLAALVAARVAEMGAQGTTTVEIKSGYGLSVEQEVRALRIAGQVTDEVTFLGAHVVPPDHRDGTGGRTRAAYVDLVTGEMLRACAPLARWIDVFCEPASPHAFDGEESRTVLEAGREAGLGLRVHGNQLDHGPGVALAVELGAASVDHCTYLSDADVDALAGAAVTTVATLLPGVEFATRSPYPDARRLLDAGVSLALASDYNPGTCGSSSMPLIIALAVREMGMTPAEALRAATLGGAKALRRDDIGRVRAGGPAHLAVVDAPTYVHLASRPGVPLTRPLHL